MLHTHASIADVFIALFNLLPAHTQQEIKEELITKKIQNKLVKKNEQRKINEFQKYLLKWPQMSDKEFKYIKRKQEHFNLWK